MSIKKSLCILLVIFSIIPVIFISVVAHSLFKQRLLEVQTRNLQRVAEANKNGLEALLETQKTEVSLLSIQEDIQQLVKAANHHKPISSIAANQLLATRKDSYKSCNLISIYDKERKIISSTDASLIGKVESTNLILTYLDTARRTAVRIKEANQNNISDGTDYTFTIGCPIIDKSKVTEPIIGYIVSTLHISYLEDFLKTITFGQTGYGILIDTNGTILYHPDQSKIGTTVSSEKIYSFIDNFNYELLSPNGTIPYRNGSPKLVYGYSMIPELNCFLIVEQNLSEIQNLTGIMLSLLVFVCSILIILIIIFATAFSKEFTAPIISLRDTMRIASDGNLTIQSNIRSNNELGELSKSFNKMLHMIRTNYEDLSSMHEELLSNEEQLRSNYEHIEFLAYHDTLTNLPNKLSLLDYVNSVLQNSSGNQQIHAMFFIDLDNFKTINDTSGHDFGDALLSKIANLLNSIKGSNSLLARAGGDEFLIFKENIHTKEIAMNFAEQLLSLIKEPVYVNGESIYVSMSIGIAIYPDNGITSNALIKNADIAMYKSKDTGKNKYTIFTSNMEDELNRSNLITEVLRNAIEKQEIYVQYQPLIEVSTNKIVGFEALMRIRSDKLGYLSPNEFIPIAEESGLIVELSTWIIREACLLNKSLMDLGIPPLSVSVNVSSVQMNRPGFVTTLSAILEETKLPPEYLELEITESTLLSSLIDATTLLTNLQSLGVKVSLDDFGTGYSSLNYLTKLPINTLKIDKSFIDNICFSDKDSRIAETIINLAHSLNIKVVAEGVETKHQLELLKTQKCDIIQGYVYSKPVSASNFIDKVKEFQTNLNSYQTKIPL